MANSQTKSLKLPGKPGLTFSKHKYMGNGCLLAQTAKTTGEHLKTLHYGIPRTGASGLELHFRVNFGVIGATMEERTDFTNLLREISLAIQSFPYCREVEGCYC